MTWPESRLLSRVCDTTAYARPGFRLAFRLVMTRTTEEGLMNAFRPKVLALAAGAATLSLTACAAGVTSASTASSASSASSPATSPAAPSQSASAAASAPGAAPSASTVEVTGQLGSFQVPAGAKVADNVVLPGQVIIIFSGITPAKVMAFYTAELPQAGYRISSSEMVSEAGRSEEHTSELQSP